MVVPERKTFEDFITKLNLKHFTPYELLIHMTNEGNAFPPQATWNNIVPTIIVLDELRERLGKPIVISSAYRGEAYNQAIGGSSSSKHIAFNALDFHVRGVTPSEAFYLLTDMRNKTFVSEVKVETKSIDSHNGRIELLPLITFERYCENVIHSFKWQGGLGLYNSYCHIDSRGYEATWIRKD